MHTGNEKIYLYNFRCIALQVVSIITHGTNAELSYREIKERTRKAVKATTLYQLFKDKHALLAKKELFFFQSSNQHSNIKLLHSEFLCMLSQSWKFPYPSSLLTTLHWFKCIWDELSQVPMLTSIYSSLEKKKKAPQEGFLLLCFQNRVFIQYHL